MYDGIDAIIGDFQNGKLIKTRQKLKGKK